ncbi:MAG: hypothetical protein ACLUPK_04425 [Veillonella sp.]
MGDNDSVPESPLMLVVKSNDFLALFNIALCHRCKEMPLTDNGIDIPYPQRVVYIRKCMNASTGEVKGTKKKSNYYKCSTRTVSLES